MFINSLLIKQSTISHLLSYLLSWSQTHFKGLDFSDGSYELSVFEKLEE